jgi:lipopolysaccharide/colanic/teichoic acid biosynthesis glycosyltransferase
MHLNLEYDFYYIAHRSVALDARIVWRTLGVLATGAFKHRTNSDA